MHAVNSIENQLPVFTTPQQQIAFYADDPSSFKQILTIYNPYDFLVKFRISCTDCSKYTVSAAQGSIKSNHSIDIVIQHKAVVPNNFGASDTVRVQLYGSGQLRVGGKKDITIILLANAPRERASGPPLETDRFQQLEADSTALGHLRQNPLIQERERHSIMQERTGFVFYVVVVVCCTVILSMPKEGDECNYLPSFIPRPSYEQKLMVAFILGMFLVLLCRT